MRISKKAALLFAVTALATGLVAGTSEAANADGGGSAPSNWHCC
jgi:hypothetical protein